jgi:hypothetical protein
MEAIYIIGVVIVFFSFLPKKGFLGALLNAVIWPVGWIWVIIVKIFITNAMQRK